MNKLFGTDGVRGVANLELTSDLAFKLGQAGAHVLTGKLKHAPVIIVGMDTRISCDMLFCALAAGLCSVGANVIKVGVIPTPGIAYLTHKTGADVGVVISASHNSFEFNGIKFFDGQGYKLDDETENQIEKRIFTGKQFPHKTHEHIGCVQEKKEYIKLYEDFLYGQIEGSFEDKHILLDCANGAASTIAPNVFKRSGAKVSAIHNEPDGVNINEKCGSTYTKGMMEKMKEEGFDIGFSYDGDADRLIAFSETGKPIDGDRIMSGLALYLKKKNKLKQNKMVATIMSNMGLEKMAQKNGIELIRTKVGDRYVIEEMRKNNYCLGGEQSGHIILTDFNTTGDGILTSIQFLNMLKNENMQTSEIFELMEEYPQVTKNARVSNQKKSLFFQDKILMELYQKMEESLKSEGRVIIRPSGTEPLIRVMLEGKDIKTITEKANEMVEIIESRLG